METRTLSGGAVLALALVCFGCQSAASGPEQESSDATATVEVPVPARTQAKTPAVRTTPTGYRPEYHPAARGYIDRMEGGLKPLHAISSLPGYEPKDAPEPAPAEPVSDSDNAQAQPREPWLQPRDHTPPGYRPEYHPETRRYIREIEAGLLPIEPISTETGSARGKRGVS